MVARCPTHKKRGLAPQVEASHGPYWNRRAQNASQVCIRTETGQLIERRIRTDRESFAKWLGNRPKARILVESSTESEWVARCLEELGHEVIVADPNFSPMYAQRSRKVKTDRRDARALCEACELGAYRPAHRSSDSSRALRAQVAVREALVQTRTRHISLIRALLRQQGYRMRSGGGATFADRVGELDLPEGLRVQMAPLLEVMRSVNAQLKAAGISPKPATGACVHSWWRRRG